jgi:membrane protein implicated in regulation of membrane protease activity
MLKRASPASGEIAQVFLVLALFLLLVLPSPWSVVALAVCLVLGMGEVLFWHGRVRGLRVQSGAETLIGQRARVVTACRPVGQVSVGGALWEARCVSGADADETVTIVGRERLVLLVEPTKGQYQ